MDRELAQLYESLNFPSANVFYKALRRRGIAVQQADVVEFVKSRSERQVSAQPPKYDGNIVAFYINHRWVADLMAFTSRPAKGADILSRSSRTYSRATSGLSP